MRYKPHSGYLHGELHQTAFELLEKREDHIVCRYAARKGEYLGFPHAFEVIQEYELQSDGLCHRVTVKNNSDENMPVFLEYIAIKINKKELDLDLIKINLLRFYKKKVFQRILLKFLNHFLNTQHYLYIHYTTLEITVNNDFEK